MERQLFTYYYPNTEGEVGEGPFQGRGRAWVRGKYAHPDYPSPLDVRVGDAGVKVWMLMQWLRLSDSDFAVLRKRFGDIVEREDVDAANWYYEHNRKAIDSKLREEEEAAIS